MKVFTVFALLSILLITIVACGNDTGSQGQPSNGGSSNANSPATPTIDPKVTPLVSSSTNTPPPPPPTPKPRPSATAAPTKPPEPTVAGATAAPTATSAPAQQLTNEMVD